MMMMARTIYQSIDNDDDELKQSQLPKYGWHFSMMLAQDLALNLFYIQASHWSEPVTWPNTVPSLVELLKTIKQIGALGLNKTKQRIVVTSIHIPTGPYIITKAGHQYNPTSIIKEENLVRTTTGILCNTTILLLYILIILYLLIIHNRRPIYAPNLNINNSSRVGPANHIIVQSIIVQSITLK